MPRQQQIEVIARGLLLHRSRVLICRNLKHGYGYLPGGHVEFGEPAAEAVKREFIEECGLVVHPGDCLFVSEERFSSGRKNHHEINIVFHVKPSLPITSDVRSLEKRIDFEWLDRAEIPKIDFRPGTVAGWLAGWGRARTPTADWRSWSNGNGL